jgi:hypothetical protein
MNKLFNMKNALVGSLAAGVIFLAGCNKDEYVTTAASASEAKPAKKISLSQEQSRTAKEMYSRMPKLRYWDAAHNRFIEMSNGSRDLVFADPDAGFNFDDPDQNGAMVYSDASGDYLVITAGVGVSGQGGGGSVVAGNTALDIDIAVCLTASEISEGDGGFDGLFGGDTGWDEYGAVFGISGDFEALMDADTESEDFDPFEYIFGFAVYYVFSEDLSGSHEVFNWLDEDADADLDDLAGSMVLDFQDFNLYFSNGGTLSVSGGQMNFNGTYVGIFDLFESFLEDDGFGDEEPEVEEVTGFGVMGCN